MKIVMKNKKEKTTACTKKIKHYKFYKFCLVKIKNLYFFRIIRIEYKIRL